MHSGDHSGINSGMAQFQRNKGSPEFQFWQSPLPNFIPADSARFRQESVGQGKTSHVKPRAMDSQSGSTGCLIFPVIAIL